MSSNKAKKRAREYYWKNKEAVLEKNRIYREKNKEAIKLQKKEYRIKNHDRIEEHRRLYRKKNHTKVSEKAHQYRLKNIERISKRDKFYYINNRERILENHRDGSERIRLNNAMYYQKNKKRLLEQQRLRRIANPERYKSYDQSPERKQKHRMRNFARANKSSIAIGCLNLEELEIHHGARYKEKSLEGTVLLSKKQHRINELIEGRKL